MEFFVGESPEYIKKERNKARELKKSQWWKQRLGNGECYYCGQKFSKGDLSMDHLVPLARGGRTSKSNCVVSCKPCNHNKKHQIPAEMILEDLNS